MALAAVILVSGFLPLAASFGLCAGKPCCRHATPDRSIHTQACCNQTNCAPSIRDTEATRAMVSTVVSLVVMPAMAAPVLELPVASCIDHRPPPTSRRLASLSVLLI